MSKIDELRPLAEIFWKFHNDRLEDPSITEMEPYLNEFIAWRDRAVLRGKIEERKTVKLPYEGDHSNCPDKRTCIGYQNAEIDLYNENEIRIAALKAELKKLEESDK